MSKIKAICLHITPNCTKGRGVEGAIDYALKKAKETFLDCQKACPEDTFIVEVYRATGDDANV